MSGETPGTIQKVLRQHSNTLFSRDEGGKASDSESGTQVITLRAIRRLMLDSERGNIVESRLSIGKGGLHPEKADSTSKVL